MTDAITIRDASKRFGTHTAVNRLSLTVPAGSICGFLGPNGAGKTTTLRMITGILTPDSGAVTVLDGQSPKAARARIGYLPEENGLYKDMRVLEMVSYFGRLRGLSRREAASRARQRLEDAGLGGRLQSKCNTLSKGMGQKAQVIGTLLHDPELVVLDEPFSGLDPVNAEMVLELIKRYKREGRTVIFSTHVVEHAEQICDSVIIIDRGERKVAGTLSEVKAAADRTVILDYDGPSGALDNLPGVLSVSDSGQQAELTLTADADSQQLLQTLIGRVKIRRFDTRETSLKHIFLKAVENAHDAA